MTVKECDDLCDKLSYSLHAWGEGRKDPGRLCAEISQRLVQCQDNIFDVARQLGQELAIGNEPKVLFMQMVKLTTQYNLLQELDASANLNDRAKG